MLLKLGVLIEFILIRGYENAFLKRIPFNYILFPREVERSVSRHSFSGEEELDVPFPGLTKRNEKRMSPGRTVFSSQALVDYDSQLSAYSSAGSGSPSDHASPDSSYSRSRDFFPPEERVSKRARYEPRKVLKARRRNPLLDTKDVDDLVNQITTTVSGNLSRQFKDFCGSQKAALSQGSTSISSSVPSFIKGVETPLNLAPPSFAVQKIKGPPVFSLSRAWPMLRSMLASLDLEKRSDLTSVIRNDVPSLVPQLQISPESLSLISTGLNYCKERTGKTIGKLPRLKVPASAERFSVFCSKNDEVERFLKGSCIPRTIGENIPFATGRDCDRKMGSDLEFSLEAECRSGIKDAVVLLEVSKLVDYVLTPFKNSKTAPGMSTLASAIEALASNSVSRFSAMAGFIRLKMRAEVSDLVHSGFKYSLRDSTLLAGKLYSQEALGSLLSALGNYPFLVEKKTKFQFSPAAKGSSHRGRSAYKGHKKNSHQDHSKQDSYQGGYRGSKRGSSHRGGKKSFRGRPDSKKNEQGSSHRQ